MDKRSTAPPKVNEVKENIKALNQGMAAGCTGCVYIFLIFIAVCGILGFIVSMQLK